MISIFTIRSKTKEPRLVHLVIILALLSSAIGTDVQAEHSLSLDHVVESELSHPNDLIISGHEIELHLRITNTETPSCFFNPALAFVIYSPDGASWSDLSIGPALLDITYPILSSPPPTFDRLFAQTFSDSFGANGSGTDTIGFAGISFGSPVTPFLDRYGIYDSLNDVCLIIKLRPSPESVGLTICLDSINDISGYEWQWGGSNVTPENDCPFPQIIPDWDGPHCFTIAPCCGYGAMGFTGNTDCDWEGKMNLADITRMIDRVYISKNELCCPKNGNIDGDPEDKQNLADITRLIDHVYVSKADTAPCQ